METNENKPLAASSPVQAQADALTDEQLDEMYRECAFTEAGDGEIRFARAVIAAAAALSVPVQAQLVASDLTPLDYRAQGREEALAVILAQDPENPFADQTNSVFGGEDYSTEWDETALRELLHIDDRKHDAYDRTEAAYWEAMGHKDEAEREKLFVAQAPFYKPLHDFLEKHKAWDLMGSLKTAALAATQPAVAPAAETGCSVCNGAYGHSAGCPEDEIADLRAELGDRNRRNLELSRVNEEQRNQIKRLDIALERAALAARKPAAPIYQVQFINQPNAWHDASEDAYCTFMENRRRIVYAAPSIPAQAGVPDGHLLMPIEPTDEMIDAACEASNLFRLDFVRAYDAAVNEAINSDINDADFSAPSEAPSVRIATADVIATQEAEREAETARLAKQYVARQSEAARVREVLQDMVDMMENDDEHGKGTAWYERAIRALQGKPEAPKGGM